MPPPSAAAMPAPLTSLACLASALARGGGALSARFVLLACMRHKQGGVQQLHHRHALACPAGAPTTATINLRAAHSAPKCLSKAAPGCSGSIHEWSGASIGKALTLLGGGAGARRERQRWQQRGGACMGPYSLHPQGSAPCTRGRPPPAQPLGSRRPRASPPSREGAPALTSGLARCR